MATRKGNRRVRSARMPIIEVKTVQDIRRKLDREARRVSASPATSSSSGSTTDAWSTGLMRSAWPPLRSLCAKDPSSEGSGPLPGGTQDLPASYSG